jgi:predicted nucleic acid-binding protein
MTGETTGPVAVIDASFAIKLLLPSPLNAECERVIDRLRGQRTTIFVPTLWMYETTSAVSKAVHFGELRPAQTASALDAFQKLRSRMVPPDDAQNHLALDWTLRLRRASAYDSYYLALAQTLRCDLWTTDRRLFNAANVSWVHLVESPP